MGGWSGQGKGKSVRPWWNQWPNQQQQGAPKKKKDGKTDKQEKVKQDKGGGESFPSYESLLPSSSASSKEVSKDVLALKKDFCVLRARLFQKWMEGATQKTGPPPADVAWLQEMHVVQVEQHEQEGPDFHPRLIQNSHQQGAESSDAVR